MKEESAVRVRTENTVKYVQAKFFIDTVLKSKTGK